ncbi:hypothetical protein Asera_45740 [Actinocatenispora sera]|uniref:Uncharacterized protein n=1 Tax=Actinocatenispora sera TaxID=390989 RepID=A0A810L805_9ACTN|nr:hypothetical protein Asera_45740 [Actinocatenispora sera]
MYRGGQEFLALVEAQRVHAEPGTFGDLADAESSGVLSGHALDARACRWRFRSVVALDRDLSVHRSPAVGGRTPVVRRLIEYAAVRYVAQKAGLNRAILDKGRHRLERALHSAARYTDHADVNAAKNILAAGPAVSACGDRGGVRSVQQEPASPRGSTYQPAA